MIPYSYIVEARHSDTNIIPWQKTPRTAFAAKINDALACDGAHIARICADFEQPACEREMKRRLDRGEVGIFPPMTHRSCVGRRVEVKATVKKM